MKTKGLFTGILASLMLLSGPVFAQDIGNTDTGENSENHVSVETESKVNIDIDNEADVESYVLVKANTGGNSIGEDNHEGHVVGALFDSHDSNNHNDCEEGAIGDATIVTGDATASAEVTNEVNTTDVTVSEEDDEDEDEDNDGQGGGPVTVDEQGGIGGGELALAETAAEGIGGGIGGGELPEAGFEGLLPPLILSSIVTFLMTLKRKRLAL